MQDTILDVILCQRDLGKALNMLSEKLKDSNALLRSKKNDIESDYQRMCDFLLMGIKDPQIELQYDNLLRRTYTLWCSIEIFNRRKNKSNSIAAKRNTIDYVNQRDVVKEHLENFVQDLAFATLLPEDKQTESLKNIRIVHAQYISELFVDISISDVWTDGMVDFTKELLLSPSIDTNDALQIISAIMLSLLNVFDVNKWRTLTEVFQYAADERVRQRSFVGWVLTLPTADMKLFPIVGQTINKICSDKLIRQEIVELQIQLYYCDNAEADNKAIEKDILPTLGKNNRFRITKYGIEEKEDDELSDILDPGAEERRIEEIEKSIGKMIDMQKAGSDIYYSGFSQMKRYPFFNEISNWFCPFYMENPAIENIKEQIESLKILKVALAANSFCDSDKYSFAFATSTIFNKIPNSLKEALNTKDAVLITDNKELDNNSPLYIRRMYLQDMYRFFRLNYRRSEYNSPFQTCENGRPTLFLSNELIVNNLSDDEILSLYKYLLKHKRYVEILLVDAKRQDNHKRELSLIVATAHLRCQHYDEASELYNNVLSEDAKNEQALKGMANIAFIQDDFKTAAQLYETLSELQPDSLSYSLNHSISLIKSGKIEEGLTILFKLEYLHKDDNRIKRITAWGYLARGDAQKASDTYDKIISEGDAIDSDILNSAYAKWALSHNKEALELFKKYVATVSDGTGKQLVSNEIISEKEIFETYNISETERKIMISLI